MVLPAMVRRHSVATLPRSGQSTRRSLSEAKLPRKKAPTSVATTKKENPEVGACLAPPTLLRRQSSATLLCGPIKRASQAEIVMDLRKSQLLRVPDTEMRKTHVSAEVREPEKRRVPSAKSEESEEMLRWAMTNMETGALQNCIDMAEAHLVRSDLISEAKTLLAKIKSERFLLAAVRRGSIVKLETALKTAMQLDVDPESDAVIQAKQTLGQIEARQALSTAIASRDEQQLKQAMEQACAAGVEKAKIDKAEQMLTRLMACQ